MANKNAQVRIATTATGDRYVVQQLDFNADKAHCWGECTSINGHVSGGVVSGMRSKMAGSKVFALKDVKISTVEANEAFYRGLIAQARKNAPPPSDKPAPSLGSCPPDLLRLVNKALKA